MPLTSIVAAQARWAASKWPGHSAKRAPSRDANLFRPLNSATYDEFGAGAGNELNDKITSLRSSSALACNVFDPWRGHDLTAFVTPLRLKATPVTVRFEQPFPHGLPKPNIPPNIDVVLEYGGGRRAGIECKFTEPYDGKDKLHPPLSAKYFDGGRRRWTEVKLDRCQDLAATIGHSVEFKRLSAGQLLKHLLGLGVAGHPIQLRYVWFDSGCSEAVEHAAEIARFESHLDPDVDFLALSYQKLVEGLKATQEPAPGYFDYLDARYFRG